MSAISKATARLPLFDRLIDENPQEREETKIKDRTNLEGLKESIQKELRMIFNTRCILAPRKGNYPTPENFGLMEYTHLNPNGSEGMKIIRGFITAIELYEPRLLNPNARILRYDSVFQKVYIQIEGMIKLGERLERFSFPLDIASE